MYGQGCLRRLMSDFWGLCGIKECRGCSQEFGIDKDVCVCDCDEVRCPVFLQGPVTQGFHQSLPPLPPFCCPLTPLILSHPSSATFLNQTSCPLFFFVVISSPSTPSNTGILINFFMFLTFLPCPRLAFIFARVFLFSSSSSSLPRLSHHTCPHHPIL